MSNPLSICNRRYCPVWLIFLIVLTGPVASTSQTSVSILWIGNSFTWRWSYEQIARHLIDSMPAPKTIRVDKSDESIAWATTLSNHWNDTDIAGKRAPDLIRQYHYTYVVLQDYLMDSAATGYYTFDSMRVYMKKFCDLIRQTGATPVIPAIWPNKTEQQKWGPLIHCYEKVAADNNALYVPESPAWRVILAQKPDYPLWEGDGHHADWAGAYVNACCFFAAITRRSPVGNPYIGHEYHPFPDSALYMQQMAWKTCDSVLHISSTGVQATATVNAPDRAEARPASPAWYSLNGRRVIQGTPVAPVVSDRKTMINIRSASRFFEATTR